MPKTKKEGILFGFCMCFIMVLFMSLLNISIHNGYLSFTILLLCAKAFPLIFIIVFILENLIISKINLKLLNYFTKKTDSQNAIILFNAFFIVTMMSFIMSIIGGLLGGTSFNSIINDFFIIWPRNFFAAIFFNLLIAGPISRFILNKYREKTAIV